MVALPKLFGKCWLPETRHNYGAEGFKVNGPQLFVIFRGTNWMMNVERVSHLAVHILFTNFLHDH